jgi:catalase
VASLAADPNAIHFLNEAFKHCKAIACDEEARQVLEETYFRKKLPSHDDFDNEEVGEGIVIHEDIRELAGAFTKAIMQHRFWERENYRKVPA